MMWIMDVVGIVVFMYVVWRVLRDSYNEVEVVALGWLMAVAFLGGGKLAGLILASLGNGLEWSGWVNAPFEPLGGWFLAMGVSSWWAWVNNWKIAQLGEDIIEALVGLMIWFELKRWLTNFDWKQLVVILELVIALIVTIWIGGRYRSLGWYRSGKKGFVFFFLSFLMLELLGIAELFLGGRVWLAIVEMISGLLFFGGLIMLGRDQ